MAGFLRLALERANLISLLALVGVAGWAFVGWMTLDMGHPWGVLMMPINAFWRLETVIAVGMMWAMMMVAMMLPSAAPMIATFEGLERRKTGPAAEPWRTPVFVAGYLVIWIGSAVAATALQWSLQAFGLVTPMAESSSPWLTSGLLAIAGLYQFSPLKQVCLRYCRSPIGFLMMEWRPGVSGAGVMGLLGLALAPALTCCLSLRAPRLARILTASIQRAPELSRNCRGSSSPQFLSPATFAASPSSLPIMRQPVAPQMQREQLRGWEGSC
jgi:Predicted metal-binding integral membrane protein (DUF2182)